MSAAESHLPMRQQIGAEVRAQVKLAAPLIASQTALMLMGLVDTAVVGRWDAEALGAVGIGGALAFLFLAIAMGPTMALDPLISQSLGQGRSDHAWHWFAAGAKLAALVSLPMALAGIACAAVLPWFGVDAAFADAIFEYMVWRAPAGTFIVVVWSCKALLQAHGQTRPLVTSTLGANVLNWAADWLLVFGDGALHRVGLPGIGLPALGAVGAAIATSLSSLFMAIWLYRTLRPRRAAIPTDFPSGSARRIFALGLPMGMQLFAEVSAFSLVGVFAAKLGQLTAGAHHVALQLASFTFMGALGISSATAVRVGLAVGRAHRVRLPGAVGTALGMCVMGTSALVFGLAPEWLVSIFTPDDPRAIAIAVPLVAIAALFQLFDGLQVVMAGALRGAGDVRLPLVANVVAHWGVGVPMAWWLAFPRNGGAVGLWYGLTLSLITVSLLLAWRFFGHVARRKVAPVTVG